MKAVILSVMLIAATARADVNLGAVEPGSNVASLRTGGEHGLVVAAGYAHGFALAERTLLVGVDASLVIANADDAQLRATASAPLVGRGPWQLHAGLAPTVRRTRDQVADMVGLALDASILAGRFSPRWFAAAELGFDAALATHITNTAAYRMVYPDARDGWYRMSGGNARGGLQGGVSFARYDAVLRLGALRDIDGGSPLLPIYATLAFAMRF